MSIARQLDSPSHSNLLPKTHDCVIRPDVTTPSFRAGARGHKKQVTIAHAGVPKAPAPKTPYEHLPTLFPLRAPEATPVVAAAVQSAHREPNSVAQPSWIIVAAVAATVGFIVWWVMFERMPDIDPRQVVATNLSAAQQAFEVQHYVEPTGASALHYYTTVLSLDPANATARSGIDRIADLYIEEAKTRLIGGRLADAGLALERARRARPDHPQLPRLNQLLRNEFSQIVSQARLQRANSAAQQTQVAKPPGESKAPQKREPEAVARSVPSVVPLPAKPIRLAQLDTARNMIGEAQSILDAAAAESALRAAQTTASTARPSPQPKVIKFVQPTYPNDALMRGIEGWVDVSLRVAPSGDVIEPRVENSTRGRLFERSALNAVRQWKYEPHAAGDPLDSERLQVRVEFRLTN